jgi:hypothetical protein
MESAVSPKIPSGATDYWWFAGLGGLLVLNVGGVLNSLKYEDSDARLQGVAILTAWVLGGLLVLFVVLLLLFAKRRRRNRVLARMEIRVIATCQVNHEMAEAMAKIRGDADAGAGYTDGDLLRWSLSLVEAGGELHFYDGGSDPFVSFSIAKENIDSVVPTVIAGHPVSFPGLLINVRTRTGITGLPVLPVGRGPAGAFSIGRARVAAMIEYLESGLPQNDGLRGSSSASPSNV